MSGHLFHIQERMNPDMNRLKLLAAVAVLGLPLAACEETTPPPPVGSIVGAVSIEGTGIDGVSVNLSNGNSTTTSGGGSYRFDNVEGGAYTVTISGFPSDATFDATSAAATIASAGQSVTLNFTGAYIRTASVMGTVTVENMGLGGVTVALSGVSSATATTDDNGQYAFTGLRMGNYAVEISGFDSDEVGFSNTAATVAVGVGESKIISFDGTYLRTAGIMGRVSVEGEGLEGIMVSLAGGPDNADLTTETDAAGQYSFAKLRAGDYAVGISGYDTDDYEFEVTSQNVTVALGETANVPFEGVLLRTAGVSGRVSVEGIGLEGVMVTLSMADADDATTMTDAGGLYAFSGLAAGDYTVAIALSEEQMAAYVFEMTSMDVTLEDDMTSIVNFEAEHAATASVTVQLFVDEGTKNDMMDEGEPTFPTAAMLATVAELGLPLALPISLAGPGVHDMQSGMAMPDGSVVFSDLKAGQYQVIVTDISDETLAALPPALGAVLRDYAYGGPATGYPVALTVGQEAKQYAPIDITHTTVNVAVTLRGEADDEVHRGAGVPGAAVTLYADAMGEDKVGEGETMANEAGHAYTSIRFARAGTTGNTVHMAVSTDDYWVDPTADMQAVMWDPMSPVHPAPTAMPPAVLNDANILNLEVDATVSGATIETEYGGGEALAGWVIGVMEGTDLMDLTPVTGDDVPTMLGADGMAAFTATVTAADLPAVYHFGVAPDQPDVLDGGESFEGSTVTHTHTGLTLAGTVDAGAIEVQYTTQTLNVYVHHERDQAHGYTGSVVGGDYRVSGKLDLSIRYIDDAGRSRSFTSTQWNPGPNTQFEHDNTLSSGAIIRGHGEAGLVVFSHLPAGYDVIVSADKSDPTDNTFMILDPDELATFRNMVENGVMGGAFGDMGGFSHTVEVCPLMAVDPTAQDHGECGSFAYVNTHNVMGQAWKNRVRTHPANDGFRYDERYQVPGTTFGVDPVDGKNLAGESKSFTAASSNSRATSWDDRKEFRFGQMAAGVYALDTPDGWRATEGPPDDDGGEDRAALGAEVNLNGDLHIDVTPATGVLHGVVTDSDNFAVEGATVDANGVSTLTDSKGRYIIEGIEAVIGIDGRPTPVAFRNERIVAVATSMEGFVTATDTMMFAPTVNQGTADNQFDIQISGVTNSIMITGQVTNILTGDGIGRVEIMVDGAAPENREKRSWHPDFGKLLTADDGTYSAQIRTKDRGQTAAVSVVKAGYHFPVAESPVLADGNSPAVVNFQGYENGTIAGTVEGPDGRALAGVTVTATSTAEGATTATDETMTNSVGQFSLNVPPVSTYRIDATLEGHVFSAPNNNWTVFAGPGQTVNFGRIKSVTAGALSVSAARMRVPDNPETTDTDESDPSRWDANIEITFTADSTNVPAGYSNATYEIQTNTGAAGAWEPQTGASQSEREADSNARTWTLASPSDGEFMVRVEATAATDGSVTTITTALEIESDAATVAAVDPSAGGVSARRQAEVDSDEADAEGNFIQASWTAVTNGNSDFRVVAEVTAASLGGATTWVVLAGPTVGDGSERMLVSADIETITSLPAAIPSGTGTAVTVTEEELAAVINIAVESVQGTADDTMDGPKWTRSAAVELAERD